MYTLQHLVKKNVHGNSVRTVRVISAFSSEIILKGAVLHSMI